MCGRFTLRATLADVAAEFALGVLPDWDWTARYNIAPTQQIAAVRRSSGGQRELVRLKWGLIPSWAKDPTIGNRMINARGETVAGKPSYRVAFRRRRCIVPADGYYEWKGPKSSKQPFLIEVADRAVFGVAGLWERWEPPGGEPVESVTLITTDANEQAREVHHRMPVILERSAYAVWLGEHEAAGPQLEELLVPLNGVCKLQPVSRYVNRPVNEGPQCVDPITL